jgi:dTDP-4-amino-4,6-dideoxygalactose transaminase
MIPVTKPYLPPFDEYQSYLEGIWKRQWLTNNGPLVNELETKITEYLGVTNFYTWGMGL